MDKQSERRLKKQRYVTVMTIIQIGFFLLCWTPYAIVSLYSAFINPNQISARMASIPALFSKSSLLWPSLLNLHVQKKETKSVFFILLPDCIKSFLNINRIEPTENSWKTNQQPSVEIKDAEVKTHPKLLRNRLPETKMSTTE